MGDLMNITEGIVRYMFVCTDEQQKTSKRIAKSKKPKMPEVTA